MSKKCEFGDIVAIAGFEEPVTIGIDDLRSRIIHDPYPYLSVDEPTLTMYFSVNDSPFSGREGTLLNITPFKDTLRKRIKNKCCTCVSNQPISLMYLKFRVVDNCILGILIENMRREGFELQVSAPEVIYKTIDGVKYEPIEYLMLDLDEEYQGVVMEKLGRRKAQLMNMTPHGNGRVRMEFEIPSRGLIGFRGQFLTDTRGSGIMHSVFLAMSHIKVIFQYVPVVPLFRWKMVMQQVMHLIFYKRAERSLLNLVTRFMKA